MTSGAVGTRRAVLDEIAHALSLAVSGVGPRTLVLTAGPGSGKTHTVRAILDSLPIATRWAAAHELSWRQPYAVVSELAGVPVPAVVGAHFDQEILTAVDALCARKPHILVVDDVHNADAGSLEVLGRLSAAAPDLPLVLVLARRHLPTRELLARLLTRPAVREWTLPAMDDADLEVLVHHRIGHWPDVTLTSLLAQSGGNPMHAITLLDSLQARGHLVLDADVAAARGGHDTALTPSLQDAVREQLSLLDETSRTMIRTLAVWGGPATLTDIAAVTGTVPASLVGPTQTVVDAGIVTLSRTGKLAFTHDVFGDVLYAELAPPLRSILHSAIADRHDIADNRQLRAHHLMAARSDDAADAVPRAHAELEHVPAVAADLLGTASDVLSADPAERTLELDLAVALARSGQLARAAEIAGQGLSKTHDIAVIAHLHRILMFTLIAQGKTPQVSDLIDYTLTLPVDDRTRAALTELRRYVALLQGDTPLTPRASALTSEASANDIATEGLYLFLSGDHAGGLALALDASQREGQPGSNADMASSSADIWPSLIEQFLHGPRAAQALLERGTSLRNSRGADWMTAYQEFSRGGIAVALGRLDDAAATLDSGLERAQSAGMGWTSLAEGSRALIDVYRGDFVAAAARLDAFAVSGLPEQFGMPQCGMARVELLEMQRKLKPAAVQLLSCWTRAESLGLYGWFPANALTAARVATRAGDDALTETILTTLDRVPVPLPPAGLHAAELARALCTGSPDVVDIAVQCARDAHDLDDVVTEVSAWEEAACASAGDGDMAAARKYASTALTLSQSMEASALSSRITSRLRALGLRLDPRVVRDRPRTGWDSLTKTEITITDMVARGSTGSDIAATLFISQRTVQTHISHALTKLGLRTRVELAAHAARRAAET
nr:LuxR family transcriptional regulator [Rhodococcus sp. (in: high G+C Gram-positive bacteria)]